MIFEARNFVAAVNKCDFCRESSEKEGFFHSRVTAADHGDFLSREEEAVAGSAGRNAVAD